MDLIGIKEQENTIHSEYGVAAEPFSAGATNNVAEYTAIIKALEWNQVMWWKPMAVKHYLIFVFLSYASLITSYIPIIDEI